MIAQHELTIIRKDAWIPEELKYKIKNFHPKSELGKAISECLRFLPLEQAAELVDRISSCIILESSLAVVVRYQPDSPARRGGPLVEDRGIVSRKKVTTEGVTALCVAWGSATFGAIYMGMSTLSTAEANTDTCANRFDTANEIAANHYAGSVRPTCTHVESTNTVPLVGVHTQTTAGDTIESHGILTSATRTEGSLWDRSLTGTTVLAVNDTLTATYTLTASAEA
jgi:hypothetical protein